MPSTHTIIVNFNAGDWLLRSIASALAGTSGLITVVDNLSEDESFKLAKNRFSEERRIRWIGNNENRGFAAANNQVLAELENDYAILLNPDCEMNEQTLEPILRAFALDSSIALASCRILNQDGSPQVTCKRRFPTPSSALARMLQLHRFFPNSAGFQNFDYGDTVTENDGVEYIDAVSGAFMVVRKAAIEQVGLLDEAYFMHCEDLDWCKRFSLEGWKVAFVSESSVIHAKGVSSASRPVRVLRTLHAGMDLYFDKFYKHQYSWFTRMIVKLGIRASLLVRIFAIRLGL